MKTLDDVAGGSAALPNRLQCVLVVDDERAVRLIAVRVLEQGGFGVLQAGDGMEALTLIQSGAEALDVVVSDIVMPRMNGVELMQTLSATHPDLPMVLMSGYAHPDLSARGIEAPCSVLSKPFPPELLLAEVRRCVRRPDGSSSASSVSVI